MNFNTRGEVIAAARKHAAVHISGIVMGKPVTQICVGVTDTEKFLQDIGFRNSIDEVIVGPWDPR